MSFLAKDFKSFKEYSRTLSNNNVNVITISERTRDRIEGLAGKGTPKYYDYLGQLLEEQFYYFDSIYSNNYRLNKSKKPRNTHLFETQIWVRK
ncbi:hypothetical protein [Halobacteriovorax sp.]|uniref:hypothetical protein n=1 Tax=Halobacteriovorax sp. TaxID=2020862 RepID=UPI003AF1FF30